MELGIEKEKCRKTKYSNRLKIHSRSSRDPASVFHALAPGQHSARSARQRGGLAPDENADGSGRLWPKRGGELSELAFFYKAASLGFGVAKPWGDSEP